MNSSNLENLNYKTSIRDEVVPSRKKITLPPWLEVAKPRLIPLLLATTLGGMALTEEWPLSSPKLICTLGGGALAAAAAGALNCLWEMELDKRMMMFTLKDSKPGEPLLLHEEPIYMDDKIIGRTTSGNYSFCYDKNLSFGYVNSGNTVETLKDKNIYIEIEKQKYPVEVLEKPLNNKNFKN